MGRPTGKYTQAHRLIDFYDRLVRGETLQSARLASVFNVNARTLQRDIAILREALSTKVETVDDPEPGLRMVSTGQPWSVTRWQLMGVALGARMTTFLSGRTFDAALRPLIDQWRRSAPAGHRLDVAMLERKLHVIELGHKQYRKSPDLLRKLGEMVDGLLLEHPMELEYLSPARRNAGSDPVRLRVQALCMTIHRGGVYFVVQDLGTSGRDAPKRILLALDRLQKVRVEREAEKLRHPADFRAEDFFATAFGIRTGSEKYAVRVRISAEYASAVEERTWHPSQEARRMKDGSLRLTMELGHLDEVADWILGMGEHARVEGPSDLIDLVRARLGRALKQYESA